MSNLLEFPGVCCLIYVWLGVTSVNANATFRTELLLCLKYNDVSTWLKFLKMNINLREHDI